jgi:hypothetical protein
MHVKFLADYTTECCPRDRQTFEAGKVYDLPEASAYYFCGRGLAVEAPPPEPPQRRRTEKLVPPPAESA